MDIEKTMQFILEHQAKMEAQIGRHDTEMAGIRSIIEDGTSLIQMAMGTVVAIGKKQEAADEKIKELASAQILTDEKMKELASAQLRTEQSLQELIRNRPQNGH